MKRTVLIAAVALGLAVPAATASAAAQPDVHRGWGWSVAPDSNRGSVVAPDWGRTPPRLPERVRSLGYKGGP